MKFYLAREGVAFGPYTEFQVRESVRLGIFESHDLVLAEDGKEWLEVSHLLPTVEAGWEQKPQEPSAQSSTPCPLPEHETRFADPLPLASTTASPNRKRRFVAVCLTAAMVFLLALAAAFQRRETPFRGVAQARLPARPVAVEKLAKGTPWLTPVFLPVDQAPSTRALPVATPERLATPAPTATAVNQELAAPARLEQSAPLRQPPVGRIEGQMLLSATNGLNYEPSSVEVRLYPLAQLKSYLEKRSSEASARFEELRSRIEAAEADKERLRKASDAAFDAYIQADASSPNKGVLEQASLEARKIREKATNDYYRLMQDREDLLSGAFYLADLPEADEATQTDGAGRFSFDVPTREDFAVVAGVQGNGSDSTKRYYWFIPVSIASEPTKMVLLSNNNLSSQGSADSLVLTID